MRATTTAYKNANVASVRVVKAKAELYNSAGTLLATYTQDDRVKNIDIQRVGAEGKFFGFGISHKASIKLIDVSRELKITTDNYFKVYMGVQTSSTKVEYHEYPKLFVTEVNRDENTNELSITAYDLLHKATQHTVSELNMAAPYTLGEYVDAATSFLDGAERGVSKQTVPLIADPSSTINSYFTDYISVDADTHIITINGRSTKMGAANVQYDLAIGTSDNVYPMPTGSYTITLEQVGGDYVLEGAESDNILAMQLDRTDNYEGKVVYLNKPSTTTGGFTVEGVRLSSTTDYQKSHDIVFNNLQVKLTIESASSLTTFDDDITAKDINYEDGANFEGTESLQDALVAGAEATQTIYYVGPDDIIRFKRLDKDGDPVLSITREQYITMDNSDNRRLQTIVSATELGDNVSASTTLIGTTQYVRNNPFWELREDIDTIVEQAIAAIGDISICQFDCSWRGDVALEPGDKIALTTKDGKTITSYLLNDTISYDGSLQEKTEWKYKEEEQEASNPSNLGDALRQTYAKVDKVNKQIDIIASDVNTNSTNIAAIQLNTDSIAATVSRVEQSTNDAVSSMNQDINTLTKKVEATISAEDIQLQIKSELSNGVDKVTTSTGFTFDESGLTVSKTGSEMTTNIDEDGMSVYRDNEEVLTADNQGVTAYNLKAKTYLIVGENSRFEDFTSTTGEARTGCFWIGG